MTTDYASALLNKNLKSAALKSAAEQNRTYSDVKNGAQTGIFDSVFENVTKNYADKSELKTLNKEKNSFAAKTKNVENARKASETTSFEKSEKTFKKSTAEKETVQSPSKQKTQNEYNKQTTENVEKNATFADKKAENLEKTQKIAPQEPFKEAFSESTDAAEQVFEKKITAEKNTEFCEAKEETASSNEFLAENDAKFDFESAEKTENIQAEQPENEDLHVFAQEKIIIEANQITNEQILANIDYEAPIVETDSVNDLISEFFEKKEAQTVLQPQNVLIQGDCENISAKNPENLQTGENISKIVLQNAISEAIPQEFVENAKNNFAKEVVAQTNLQDLQGQNSQEIMDKTPLTPETELDIEVKNWDNLPKNAEISAKPKTTAQQSLAADNSRLILNLESAEIPEKNTILDENPVLTPTKTISETSTDAQEPMIQVTEKVAREISSNLSANLSNSLENKDFAGNIKDKIAAKLGEIDSTSTLVTEVQNSSTKPEMSQTGANSQGNSSLAQGNAAEQAIKMSIEEVSVDSSSDSFMNQLEAKLNASSKALNSKQPAMLNKSDIMSQLNVKLNEMQNAGQSKVSMILQPENLGRVSIEIINSKDGIIAKMTTDNQQVKELFDKNIEALRSSLSSQGVNVNNIKVECTNQSENNAMDFERQQFEQNSQDFRDSQGRNNHANHSNQSTETTYFDGQAFDEESEESEITNAQNDTEIKNTVKHNGKIDYKV